MLPQLRRAAIRLGPLAAASSSAAYLHADCKASTINPHGLSDAEWYQQQNDHIALGLPLIEEARQGWWHEVTRRLRLNGEDANARDARSGSTLLHLACAEGRRRLVEELLERGAVSSRDLKGRTPLHCCAEHGSETVAATLCEAKCGLVADVNEQDDTGATALSIASRLGHVRLVRWLCHRKELRPWDVDRYGVAALHKATSFGQLACVEALVADKRVRENIDQRVGRPTVPDEYVAKTGGESALHLACAHTYRFHHTMHTKIAKVLLQAGADPNALNGKGQNACHCAAAAGNVGILKELAGCARLRKEAWDVADHDGCTARELGARSLGAEKAYGAMQRRRSSAGSEV